LRSDDRTRSLATSFTAPRDPLAAVSVRAPALRALLTLLGAAAVSACGTLPRATVEPESEIAAAARLPAAIEFRLVGLQGSALDEPEPVADALLLDEAVRRAVTTDPGLQASLARVRIALAEADQARLLPNPVLSVVFRAGAGNSQIEASFAQEFVPAHQRPTRARAAHNRLRAVAAEAVVTALDVISDVQESYVDAQSSAALVPIFEERLDLLERLVSTARARLEAGEGTRADVVTLDAQRVELLVAIDRTRLEERTSRLRLARLIGQPSSEATWTLDAWTSPEPQQQSERGWINAALLARPEIQAIAWRMRAMGDEDGLLRLLPWEGASVGVEAQRDGGWQLGPALSTPLPIFDDGSAQRALLVAEQLEARHELTLVRRRVVEEVRVAYQSLVASVANLERIRRELIPLQEERRQLAEDSYRAGQTDVTPLFLAEQDLRVAQLQAVEVEAQAARALVRLQRAVGGPGVAERLASTADSDGTLRLATEHDARRASQP
jgi:cobalt-zinc-cadmium efflux system outer membrane protein